MQAQKILLDNGAVPLMVQWLAAGPDQEVATAAARALAKAAKGNRKIQTAICEARAWLHLCGVPSLCVSPSPRASRRVVCRGHPRLCEHAHW